MLGGGGGGGGGEGGGGGSNFERATSSESVSIPPEEINICSTDNKVHFLHSVEPQ